MNVPVFFFSVFSIGHQFEIELEPSSVIGCSLIVQLFKQYLYIFYNFIKENEL